MNNANDEEKEKVDVEIKTYHGRVHAPEASADHGGDTVSGLPGAAAPTAVELRVAGVILQNKQDFRLCQMRERHDDYWVDKK